MKFGPEDDFVTVILRTTPEHADFLRHRIAEAEDGGDTRLFETPVEVVRIGTLPDPAEYEPAEVFRKRPCPRCPVREPHSHTRC